MVEIIDTHCHVYANELKKDWNEVISNAKKQNLAYILMPNIDADSIESMHHLADKFPGYCLPMMGLHPCSVTMNWEKEVEEILTHFKSRNYIAVGEIGIDLYWDKTTLPYQEAAFRKQIEFAVENALPVSIHSRSATQNIISILKEYKGEKELKGVFHCFTESLELAQEILKLDFYLGIGGVLTFKNAGISEVVKQIPLQRIILETDSPYLAPVPYRGKRNEPAYTRIIATHLGEILQKGFAEICNITSNNAKELFQIESYLSSSSYV